MMLCLVSVSVCGCASTTKLTTEEKPFVPAVTNNITNENEHTQQVDIVVPITTNSNEEELSPNLPLIMPDSPIDPIESKDDCEEGAATNKICTGFRYISYLPDYLGEFETPFTYDILFTLEGINFDFDKSMFAITGAEIYDIWNVNNGCFLTVMSDTQPEAIKICFLPTCAKTEFYPPEPEERFIKAKGLTA